METTMSVGGVQSQQYANAANSSSMGSIGGGQEVDKQEFLMLLVAQLRNQDPMKPMEDREFIAQLAQFNTLEQMQMLNRTVAAANEMTILGQLASFVGKEVEALGGSSGTIKGVVTGVTLIDGSAVLTVGDEQVDVRNVFAIRDAPPVETDDTTTETDTDTDTETETDTETDPVTETPATETDTASTTDTSPAG
jgi:flagellar basal-body rod modification protein FlgD